MHDVQFWEGNADGKGDTRKEELYQACASLKVGPEQVKILDHPDLQDGFNHIWSQSLLAEIVKKEIASRAIDLLITFDCYGVSGHQNHRDVHHGIQTFLHETPQRSIEAWELWTGGYLVVLTTYQLLPKATNVLLDKWASTFRKLFVSFSSYTYVNVLKKINV
ncbi:hypothetical protein C5167_017009 [Papaver somniferum]|uniref:N-acetylglucosaminylphosphatidylinositol deacetylase n=1 Tax=Papaver somniferum TaxID=3469 RepID=A0A4Y7II72_PAPSO|nr:hypothetical protein C5167_017009 [Papaver somniferum]